MKVEISDDDAEFDTLDEVKDHRGDRVPSLQLQFAPQTERYSHSVGLYIDGDGVTVVGYRDDALLPFWHELKEFFEHRAPWYAKYMKPLVWLWLASIALWFAPSGAKLHSWPSSITYGWMATTVGTFSMAIASWCYLYKSRGVYLKRPHEVSTFWGRYGEKILFLILGTVVGVLGKVLADRLSGR